MMKTLALLWHVYISQVINWIPANIQALFLTGKKQEGQTILRSLQDLAPNLQQISSFLADAGFVWSQDPLWGVLDFYQKAWVTCARKKGDCDDFAELWKQILKEKGKVETLVTVKKSFQAHKMVVFTKDGTCSLLSNMHLRKQVNEQDKDVLLNDFYGDKTWFTIVY